MSPRRTSVGSIDMRRWIHASITTLFALTVAATSGALPPNERGRGFREGANHHLGDDGFVAQLHRRPGPGDSEALRMKEHLVEIRARLAARPATRPELAPTRAAMLGYLDDYIARGITPRNEALPWRSPVFIDDDGAICAVGYLVERSAGRPMAEAIAAAHRYAFLEDIAASMPPVREWIDASGLSLEELASIQPGYMAPEASTWHAWDKDTKPATDGPVAIDFEGQAKGSFRNGRMDGAWTRTNADGSVVGQGVLRAGAGTWRASYANGARMAEGPYADNRPHGEWRFYHPSGHLAAVGRFERGVRSGFWQFFQDKPTRVPIAEGSFAGDRVDGTWRHYDAGGKLLAVSSEVTPALWRGSFGGHLLDVLPGADGVHHWVHEGDIDGDTWRLDMLADGSEIIYQRFGSDVAYDAHGHRLVRVEEEGWTESDCGWSAARVRTAAHGDLVTLHGYFFRDQRGGGDGDEKCSAPRLVSVQRSQHLDAMLASTSRVRAVSPGFVQQLVLGDRTVEDADVDETAKAGAGDLAKILAASMAWYVEWPHVDGRFIAVFKTLPGFAPSS